MAEILLGIDGVASAEGGSNVNGSLIIIPVVFSNSAAKKWYDIVQRKGIDATVRTYPAATFSPDTNKTILRNVREFSIKIVPPYNYIKEGYGVTTLITSGRGLTGFANYLLSFVVKVGIKLIINDKEWTVVSITPIQDNTGILYYILEIESGN